MKRVRERVRIRKEVSPMTKQSALINTAIDKRSPSQKTVFTLHYYEGLQIKEIAQRLGMAEGTVKIHLHRAVKKLKDVVA